MKTVKNRMATKAHVRSRLETLLTECQQAETVASMERRWNPQCLEAYQVYAVQSALNKLQAARGLEAFQASLDEPKYTIDYSILDCLVR